MVIKFLTKGLIYQHKSVNASKIKQQLSIFAP